MWRTNVVSCAFWYIKLSTVVLDQIVFLKRDCKWADGEPFSFRYPTQPEEEITFRKFPCDLTLDGLESTVPDFLNQRRFLFLTWKPELIG